jgi:hypothetical protein
MPERCRSVLPAVDVLGPIPWFIFCEGTSADRVGLLSKSDWRLSILWNDCSMSQVPALVSVRLPDLPGA